MSKLLAVETSTEACSVALYSNGETKEFYEHAPMRHAELLLPAIQSLLDAAGLPLADLDAIAFGRGPGSFTSLRIGIGVVQGLAWGAGLPVIPVSSLAAVAQQSVTGIKTEACAICVAMDARMQEVYTANFRYRGDGFVMASGAERVCSPSLVSTLGSGSFIASGNGFERYEALQAMAASMDSVHAQIWPRASVLAGIAVQWLASHKPLPAEAAQPVYLRDKVAEKPS